MAIVEWEKINKTKVSKICISLCVHNSRPLLENKKLKAGA